MYFLPLSLTNIFRNAMELSTKKICSEMLLNW